MFYKDNDITVYNKDCRSMDELADESIQCITTSPPYWGLRKYSGVPDLVWGGDKDCEHQWGASIRKTINPQRDNSGGLVDNRIDTRGQQSFTSGTATEIQQGNFCQLCGAWKGSYGLEPTPDCGRPFMKLRGDLTPKEKEYILSELRKFGAM